MRPQLAMAALFMFVIGSSLLLLRARPGTMAPPVLVSEQGRPEREAETQTVERGNRLGGAAATAAAKGVLNENDRDDRPAPAAAPNDEGLARGGAPSASAFGGPESASGEPGQKMAMPGRGCSDAELALKSAVKQADKDLARDALAACRKGDGGPGMPTAPAQADPQATATASSKPSP